MNVPFFQHTATFARCQAIFTMKIAKKYAIMVIVNNSVFLCSRFLSILYMLHKNSFVFL